MLEGSSMNNLFALEQFSRDSFRVKRTYIDITGDLIAGILLGQIVYWNLPNENGQSKLKVMKDGEMWLAKGRCDWWDEIRITPKQFDRAIKILQEKGFVESKRFKFNGAPTIHIKLNILFYIRLFDLFPFEAKHVPQNYKSFAYPNVPFHLFLIGKSPIHAIPKTRDAIKNGVKLFNHVAALIYSFNFSFGWIH